MDKNEFKDAVVIMATNSWDGMRMADPQLADQLAQFFPVVYVDPPTSIVSRLRRRGDAVTSGPRLTRIRPGLARLIPEAAPGLSRPGVASFNARLVAWQVRHALSRLRGSARVVIDASILMPIMDKVGASTKVYWAQDDFVGIAPLVGLDASQLERGEAWMVNHADRIIAANPVVAASVESAGRSVDLIPFGCDYDHFASTSDVAPAADVTLAAPMAVFMGHLGDRINLEILREVAGRDINLLVVGPRHGYADASLLDDVLSRPNVQWVGPKSFDELPSYLAHGNVGLLPYTHSKFNLGSFPLKTLEYLAAGLPVVATSLPAIAWLDTAHISVADEPAEFADKVVEFVNAPADPDLIAARRSFAAKHTWAERARAFAEVIKPV